MYLLTVCIPYDLTTGAFITGSPGMSVVYPAGTYDYVVEYTK